VSHFVHYFFAEPGAPWYHAAVWGNVVAVIPCGILAFAWSRTKFWPLHALHGKLDSLHAKHDLLAGRVEDLHRKR
jgi:hypothetical protein